MDSIILSGIDTFAYGGVTDAEKAIGQRYRVNVVMRLDLHRASETDDLVDTVSYTEAHRIVVDTMRARSFNLLESMAGEIATCLLRLLPLDGVTVELQKLLPPIDGVVAYAAVVVNRDAPSA